MQTLRFRRPRCVLVYALAPGEMGAAEANRHFNNKENWEQLQQEERPTYGDPRREAETAGEEAEEA